MIFAVVIMIVSLFLDGIFSNFLPYLVGDLSLFTPLLSVVSIFIVYPYFYKDSKRYFILAFIFGFIYDLFYTNLLFFNGFLFLFIAFITTVMTKNMQVNMLNILYEVIIGIVVYELISAILFVMFNLVPISFSLVFYKIGHSLLLNIIYVEIIYLIMKKFNNKIFKRYLN